SPNIQLDGDLCEEIFRSYRCVHDRDDDIAERQCPVGHSRRIKKSKGAEEGKCWPSRACQQLPSCRACHCCFFCKKRQVSAIRHGSPLPAPASCVSKAAPAVEAEGHNGLNG